MDLILVTQYALQMKSQSQFLSNGRSLFSLNTVNTGLPNLGSQSNELHQFYYRLMSEQTYPNLCKILFLQLVLRENVLIYSDRRVEIKQVWNTLNRRIGEKVGNIYVVDQLTKIEEILSNKSEYKRILVYDLTEMSNSGLNYLINNQEESLTLTVVQNSTKVIRNQLTDLFPFVFHYDGETESIDLLAASDVKDKKKDEKFQKEKFYQCVTQNFNLTLEAKEQEGFLKAYLAILREKAAAINIPLSRWKKMLKVLHFIGLTKTEGAFKRFSLADCLMTPECLGRTCAQIQNLRKINEETILMMLPYFGTQKWIKQLSSHFWINKGMKLYFTSLAEKLRGKVSFFYPCSKYPDMVKLIYQQSTLFYRVVGFDKKLMSDKYYDVQQGKQYKLSLKYRSPNTVVMHFGVACYDQDKNIINPVQVCRFEDTAITVAQIEGNRILCRPQEIAQLSKWKDKGSFAYQKCIGIYYNGHIDKLLTIQDVLYSEEDSYSKEEHTGVYSKIGEGVIQLTQKGQKMLGKIKDRVMTGKTMIVNHFQGGTYAIGHSQAQKYQQWKEISLNIKGSSRINSGKQFLLGTKYIRVVIMSNYNSGYPDFKVENKGAYVDIRDVEWIKA